MSETSLARPPSAPTTDTGNSSPPPELHDEHDSGSSTDEEYQLVGEGSVPQPSETTSSSEIPSAQAAVTSGFDALMSLADAAEAKNDVTGGEHMVNSRKRGFVSDGSSDDQVSSVEKKPKQVMSGPSNAFRGNCGRHVNIAYNIFFQQRQSSTQSASSNLDPTFEARRLKERTEWMKRQRTEMMGVPQHHPQQPHQQVTGAYMGGALPAQHHHQQQQQQQQQYYQGYYQNPYMYGGQDPAAMQQQYQRAMMMMAQQQGQAYPGQQQMHQQYQGMQAQMIPAQMHMHHQPLPQQQQQQTMYAHQASRALPAHHHVQQHHQHARAEEDIEHVQQVHTHEQVNPEETQPVAAAEHAAETQPIAEVTKSPELPVASAE